MSRLDDELKNALRREEPPPGFAERVLARAQNQPRARRWWMLPQARWAAAAAAVALVTGGVEMERARRMRAQGEFAREQVMLALRITGSKLQLVKEKVNGIDIARH